METKDINNSTKCGNDLNYCNSLWVVWLLTCCHSLNFQIKTSKNCFEWWYIKPVSFWYVLMLCECECIISFIHSFDKQHNGVTEKYKKKKKKILQHSTHPFNYRTENKYFISFLTTQVTNTDPYYYSCCCPSQCLVSTINDFF